jgi:hypothetical protein
MSLFIIARVRHLAYLQCQMFLVMRIPWIRCPTFFTSSAVSRFEYIKPRDKRHARESGHPEQGKWILEESSTGFRRNDIKT